MFAVFTVNVFAGVDAIEQLQNGQFNTTARWSLNFGSDRGMVLV